MVLGFFCPFTIPKVEAPDISQMCGIVLQELLGQSSQPFLTGGPGGGGTKEQAVLWEEQVRTGAHMSTHCSHEAKSTHEACEWVPEHL